MNGFFLCKPGYVYIKFFVAGAAGISIARAGRTGEEVLLNLRVSAIYKAGQKRPHVDDKVFPAQNNFVKARMDLKEAVIKRRGKSVLQKRLHLFFFWELFVSNFFQVIKYTFLKKEMAFPVAARMLPRNGGKSGKR